MKGDKHATVYSLRDCVTCDQVKAELIRQGFRLTVLCLQGSLPHNADLRAALDKQNGVAPLVLIEGEYVNPREIIAGKTQPQA